MRPPAISPLRSFSGFNLGFLPRLRAPRSQSQGVPDDDQIGETHRRGAKHGIEKAQGGKRNAGGVVEERPEQILFDRPQGRSRQSQSFGHGGNIGLQQDDVGGFASHVAGAADSDAEVGLFQRRRVIDADDDEGHAATLGLNLLPADRRARSVNPKTRLNFALGAASAVLLALIMTQALYLRSHQGAELEEAITSVQGEAREVMQIKQQIEDTSEAAGFLAMRRAEAPLAIEVLSDVTRLLPDNTYLDRLVITKSGAQMQGKSQNAQQLIELVNQSHLLDDASFRGSTRLDARSGLEIFEVNAAIRKAETN